MGLPEQLEVVAHGATVILATWLGLTVGLRAPRRAGARAFGVLAALLVVWSLSIIVRRLTTDPGVDEVARWFEVTGSSLLPPAVLTVATALTVERQTPRWLAISLVGFWAVSIAVVVLTVVAPELEPRVAPPHLSFPGIPGEVRRLGVDRVPRRDLRAPRSPGSRSRSATSGRIARAGGSSRSPCSPSSSARSVACSGSRHRSRTATRGSACRSSRCPSCWPRTPSSPRASSSRPRSPGVPSASRHSPAWASPSTSASCSAWTASPGGFLRSTSRSSSAWRWWRPWPSSSRWRRGCGAGWAPATATRPTTGCFAPSAQGVLTTRRPEDSIEPALGQLARTMGLDGAEVREPSGARSSRRAGRSVRRRSSCRCERDGHDLRLGRVRSQGVRPALHLERARGPRDGGRLPRRKPGARRPPGRAGTRPRTAVPRACGRVDERAPSARRPGSLTGRCGPKRAARVRPRPVARGTRRRAHPPVGRREGRNPPGGGALRVPLRPRRARRHEGRGGRADLAGRRPRARRPRVPSHARRAASNPRARTRPAPGLEGHRLLE